MEEYNSIKEYLDSVNWSKEDLKGYILRTALNLGCECAHMFEGETEKIEEIFMMMDEFNDILDNVK